MKTFHYFFKFAFCCLLGHPPPVPIFLNFSTTGLRFCDFLNYLWSPLAALVIDLHIWCSCFLVFIFPSIPPSHFVFFRSSPPFFLSSFHSFARPCFFCCFIVLSLCLRFLLSFFLSSCLYSFLSFPPFFLPFFLFFFLTFLLFSCTWLSWHLVG